MTDPKTDDLQSASSELKDSAVFLLEVVQNLVNEIHPQQMSSKMVRLDSLLDRDLGLDSLGRVELMARLEKRFQVTISEQAFAIAETPRDFLRFIISPDRFPKVFSPASLQAIDELCSEPEKALLNASTLTEVLYWHAEKYPDRIHIRFYHDSGEDDVLTYCELLQGAKRVAASLQGLGLKYQQSVMIMLPSSREYFYSFFGILIAGGVPVPVYPPGNIRQIEEHLRRHAAIAKNCLAFIMIAMPETVRFSKIMRSQVPGLRHLVTYNELIAIEVPESVSLLKPKIEAGDIAFLQYTSGSTGLPKGVALTHANLLANIRSMGQAIHIQSSDVFVSWLPLYHDMGLIGAWLGSFYFSCHLILMSPLNFIARPFRWLHAISHYGGTLSAAPNFAYELCVRRIELQEKEKINLDSWRIALNGAEAVSPQTIQRFSKYFNSCGFRSEAMTPVYGLAESSVGLAFPPLDRGPLVDIVDRHVFMQSGKAVVCNQEEKQGCLQFVSCGQPLPGHQIRIADKSGRELPERQQGDVQFQGPSATSGYFRNPEKTDELFTDQWLNSGDKGYIAGGEVYITGRSKDIIIRAGRNIYPEELEAAIGKIDGIRAGNVAVFGSRDKSAGTERLIVLAESRKKEPVRAKLVQHISGLVTDLVGLPPEDVVLAPPNTVLKTSSGKIRRAACRDIYELGLSNRKTQAVWFQVVRFWLSGLPVIMSQVFQVFFGYAYASYCWLLFSIGALAGICMSSIPRESSRWGGMKLVLKSLAFLAGWKIKVTGQENIPSQDTTCVFVANHASYIDGFVLLAIIPRIFSFVAKSELQENCLLRILLGRIGTEYVDRFDKEKGVKDYSRLLQRSLSGRSLFYFAEGTFVRQAGLLPFKMGAFETASKGELPLVPICIRGTRSILRAGSWFPRHGTLRVTFGEPLGCVEKRDDTKLDKWQLSLNLRDQARAWILEHCGEPDLKDERSALFAANGREKSE